MPVVNKNSPFTVSILGNSTKVVSSTEDNWAGVRNDGYIKIEGDSNLYTIAQIKNNFYLQDFVVVDSRIITINKDTEINLQKNDTIKISYKEYELDSILGFENRGENYEEGDIITVINGEQSINVLEGMGYPTKLKIESINDKGEVQYLSVLSRGKYIVAPKGKIELMGGRGSGLELELSYSVTPDRAILERVISDIQYKEKENNTIICLDYSIPANIKEGKLSAEKYVMTLNQMYLGPTRKNVGYQIFKDFTPNLRLPLLVKNSFSVDTIFNKSMNEIDKQIQDLKNRISKLEKRSN